MRPLVRLSLLLLLVLLHSGFLSVRCVSQSKVVGEVRDNAGKGIEGARITMIAADGSLAASTISAQDGSFSINALDPGAYTIDAARPGHPEITRSKIVVVPGRASGVDLILGTQDPTKGGAVEIRSSEGYYDDAKYKPESVSGSDEAAGYSTGLEARSAQNILELTGQMADRSGDTSKLESVQQLRARLSKEGQNAEIFDLLGRSEEKAKDFGAAALAYSNAVQIRPSETYVFDWGNALLAQRAYPSAASAFEFGVAHFPESRRLKLGLAVARYFQGEYHAAVELFFLVSDLQPSDPRPYFFLSLNYPGANTQDLESMLARLRRFTNLDPKNGFAYFYYASALWNNVQHSTRLDEIESSLRRAIALQPDFPEAHFYLGAVLDERQLSSEAIAEFQRSVALQPRLESAHYRLAQLYSRTGQKSRAAKEFEIFELLRKQSQSYNESQCWTNSLLSKPQSSCATPE